jgi:hypothetical protein
MDLLVWLNRWLGRHPLREPSELDRAAYTAQVMERVTVLGAPSPEPAPARSWLPWPRLAMVVASVAVGVLVAVGILHERGGRIAQEEDQVRLAHELEQNVQVLAALDELLPIEVAQDPGDLELLAE